MGRTLDSDASAQDNDLFGAQFTAPRSPGFLVEPRRGFNSTRLMKTETGTGASLSRSGGEFQLETGTATDNVVQDSGDNLTEGSSSFNQIPVRFFVDGSSSDSASVGDKDQVPLGGTREFTLSAKNSTASNAEVSAVVTWREGW